ncbi:hypothetical protein [Candidatus Lucifugimonas marina]|uniref:Zinc ribbon domain-containing protein n=1 Tax=Candidatus Lucifugimonas marina TaxID=3038979 RepID=A0AAJ5ZIT4_9CHLR|nr:hypothetical protein [SAR202 cluster bacterium JH702]MDG0868921.1 hypothetical protein [SAR202 cluster bacterium JH639]WFG35549.1 hypothetical protein GKN94_07530 [SAR202 cluster bacterium JH545]WFG39496.1 hypothetical protein GKO48_07645 [SAR202 cluster bacterium JH1073]
MAETKDCKQCGKYNSVPAKNCVECGQPFPEPGVAMLASNTGAKISKFVGLFVGFIVVVATMMLGNLIGNGFSAGASTVGFYTGLIIWIVIFKLRNEFPLIRPTVTWLFPAKNWREYLPVIVGIALIIFIF